MPTIKIPINGKIAVSPVERIVCGNSDYKIEFLFDEAWASHDVKTARFVYNGQYEDKVFRGNVCDVPVISGANVCAVGVYAGNLRTTTPALISCEKSILCGDGLPADPAPDVYAQIMERLDSIDGADSEVIEKAVREYLDENPVQAGATAEQAAQIAQNKADIERLDADKLDADQLPEAINDALAQAKASGEFDGKDGDDYVLTQADKREIASMVEVSGGGGSGGIVWTDLGVVDSPMEEMGSILAEGFYRLSDGEFTYSLQVEVPDDRYVAQTYWGTEELKIMEYRRTGYRNDDGEIDWSEWDNYTTWNTMQQFAPKNHNHLTKSDQLDFLLYLTNYNSGQQQITVVADGKSYIVEQYNYTDTTAKMIYYAQRYFEIHEPWKVYFRSGSMPNKAGSKLTWDEWACADDDHINALIDAKLGVIENGAY